VVLSLLGLDRRRWNPWAILTANRDLYANAHASLERVGLGEAAQRILAETSYGERRRLELAMALAQKPKLLLLDEPLAGLSQAERQTVRALLDAIPRVPWGLTRSTFPASTPITATATCCTRSRSR